MVGHFVNQLTPSEEDTLLGERLGEAIGYYNRATNCRCILGALYHSPHIGISYRSLVRWEVRGWFYATVANRWDTLCARFGDARIANATRNRILSNRAYRVLGAVQDTSGVRA